MKRIVRLLATLALACAASSAPAQGRVLGQPELDALLAPIALYPDPLLAHVLNAAVYPQDVAEAATWSRANPRLQGDDALRAVDAYVWHPSVKALVAYPDILARMAESPKWVADLGEAYVAQSAEVTATVQGLRARAQATGNLQSDSQQQVYTQDDAIYVQPVYPQYVWVPYYDPFVVYGAWWWPAFRPFYFRPWVPRFVVVNHFHVVRSAPALHWRPRPAGQPAHWHTAPQRQLSAPAQRQPAPARSFTPTNFKAPRASNPPTRQWAQPQRPAPQAQMPAAHVRATPVPMQQGSHGHAAVGGGWANGGRRGGGHGGGRRG